MQRGLGVTSPSFPSIGVAVVGMIACTWSSARSHAALPTCGSAGLDVEWPPLSGVRPVPLAFLGVAPKRGVVGCIVAVPQAGALCGP